MIKSTGSGSRLDVKLLPHSVKLCLNMLCHISSSSLSSHFKILIISGATLMASLQCRMKSF